MITVETAVIPRLYLIAFVDFTVRFTKLLKNGFRSSFEIPEVHYERGNGPFAAGVT